MKQFKRGAKRGALVSCTMLKHKKGMSKEEDVDCEDLVDGQGGRTTG